LTGVLTYTFGAFRVISSFQGENQNAFVASTNRPDVPSLSGSRTFATFNVLNFFTTFGSRGAENAEEFDRQLKKLVNAIIQSDADIYGLIEIENDFSSNGSPIQTLVTAINDKLGIDEFTYVQPPTDRVGSDAIAVALIYKKSTIREFPGATPAVLDFEDMKTRAALAQSFQAANDDDDNSPCFTVSVNHFKSKGGCATAIGADQEQADAQGCFNATRVAMAKQLLAAKLNYWDGNDTSCIDDAIAQADAWLISVGGIGVGIRTWDGLDLVHDELDAYNNGLLCAPHRDRD